MSSPNEKPERGWVTKRDLANFFDVSEHEIWRKFQHLVPVEATRKIGNRLWFHGRTLLDSWLAEEWRKKAGGPVGETDEMLAGGKDSPNLERYRLAKAKLAEMELMRQQGNLLPREQMEQVILRLNGTLRQAVESIQRQFGNDASVIIDEALDDWEKQIERLFSDDGSDSTDPPHGQEDEGIDQGAATPIDAGVRRAGNHPAHRAIRRSALPLRKAAV